MNLSQIDIGMIAAYFIGLFVLGVTGISRKHTDENYLLMARKLSLPAFIMTIVTTWYGLILGVGEFIFSYGVVGWVTNGLLWYLVYFLFAMFMAKRIQKSKLTTVADQFYENYGKKSGGFAAILTFVMATPAPYVLSFGVLLNALFGISVLHSSVIGIVFSAIYVWFGGFRAVVRTDIFQFIFMYLGFGLLLIFSVLEFGGLDFLADSLPSAHLTFVGDLGLGTVIVWGLLAMWTLVDPTFYQRCYAAKDGNVAKRGVLYAIVFWFLFDMLTLSTGLYARAAFSYADPLFSYLVLADSVFPIVFKGLFVVTLLSIIMSTIDSFLFVSGTIVASDFMKKLFSIHRDLEKISRMGIAVALIFALGLIVAFDSIIGIVYAVGTVGVSVLLVPIVFTFFSRTKLNDSSIFVVMFVTFLSAFAWLCDGWVKQEAGWPVYRYGIEPMYVGIFVSWIMISVILLLSIKKKRNV